MTATPTIDETVERITTRICVMHAAVAEDIAKVIEATSLDVSAPNALRMYARAIRDELAKQYPGRQDQ